MTATDKHKDRTPAAEGKVAPGQEPPRKGVFWDKAARQWATRIGYRLGDDGRRVREPVRRLGADPDDATLRHIKLQREWDAIEEHWAELSVAIRPGLPEDLRDTADLSKPVWLKKEWADAAQVNTRQIVDELKMGMLGIVVDKAAAAADQIDSAKDFLNRFRDRPGQPSVVGLLPEDLKARVLQALQPAANQVRGVAPDARPMTLTEAKEAFVEYKRTKIGLNLKGRRGGIKGATLNTIRNDIERAFKIIEPATDLRDLTHERLEKLIDNTYALWGGRTAFNTMRSFKAMLDWCHRTSSIDYRHIDEVDEVFRLSRPETQRKDGYDADTVKRLKLMKAACKLTVEKGGEETWLFVLLALNCGAYQCDLASLTYDNLKFTDPDKQEGPYLWWQRAKELHHNPNLWTRHDLWPSVWERMKKHLARDDPERNPTRRLFLSNRGTALQRDGADRGKTCLISLRFRRARANAKNEKGEPVELDLPFLQLRKISLNAIKRFSGGSDDVTRKFAGQKQPGILKHYLTDEFEDVSAALAKWGEQLKADGVL